VDGVITARMHLCIAALGMGLPVAALTYQDKFQGLFHHFGLSEDWLLAPEQILAGNALEKMMLRFIDENAVLKRQVQARLPEVKRLAMLNFESLFPQKNALEE
jgi:polysaccharide pyruvyl transferase WcaK-like protein